MKTRHERRQSPPFFKRRVFYFWLCFLSLVVVVGCQVYLSVLQSLPLSYHAKRVFKAIDNEDSRTLLEYTLEAERSKGGLNSENLRELLRWMKVHWESYPGRDGEIVIDHEDDSSALLACYRDRVEGGAVLAPSLGFTLHKSDEGPVFGVTTVLIKAGLYARYAPHNAEVNSVEKMWTSLSLGLKSEMATLKRMGLKGVVETDSEMTFISFESLQRRADRVVQRLRWERGLGSVNPG